MKKKIVKKKRGRSRPSSSFKAVASLIAQRVESDPSRARVGRHAIAFAAYVARCHYSGAPTMAARVNHFERAGAALADRIHDAIVELEAIAAKVKPGSRKWIRATNIAKDLQQAAFDVDDAAHGVIAAKREEESKR